ncbi:MAG: amino acid adenylation domain-containing protein [Bryobacteraceae bacterium]
MNSFVTEMMGESHVELTGAIPRWEETRPRVDKAPLGHASLEPDENTMREMVATSLDHIVHHLQGLSTSPADDAGRGRLVARAMEDALPENGESLPTLLRGLFQDVIPASVNTAGPGYLGYVPGGGIFPAALADFIAKSVNRHVGYYYMSPAMVQLEWNVVRWFCDIAGYGPEAGGVLTSGGSMATLTAIIAARSTRLGEDFGKAVIYLTSQTHYSVAKAALLAGFPERCLRMVAVDANFRMDATSLESMIAMDRAVGLQPFLVAATAGTTNTGAVDPLDAIATVAEREGLWMHVDGAYGGFFLLTETGRKTLAGIERADSITLDPHKGLCLPYGTGALVVRNLDTLKRTYSARAEYLPAMNEVDGEVDFCGLSPELSRDWRGLRVWLPLKMYGVAPFRQNLDEKLALAHRAELALRAMPNIEIVAGPQLSILAFRLVLPGRSSEETDEDNRRLLEAIVKRQRVLLSSTRLNGRFTLRFSLLSFRTHEDRVMEGLEDIRSAALEVMAATPAPGTLAECFVRQAKATPARVAIIAGERRVTFAALDNAAEQLASKLRSLGLKEGGHAGIYMPRSVEAIVSMLAVLKAGGVYVPINPHDPSERRSFIVSDAGLDLMICAGNASEARTLLDPTRVLDVNEMPDLWRPTPVPRQLLPLAPGDRPIYLLYTSGSTGRSKGVVGLQSATLNRLHWMWREFPFAPGEKYLHRTALTFVDAVWEIFGPLLQGVPLVLLPPQQSGNPGAMAALIQRYRVTRVTVVPSILDALVSRTRQSGALSSVRVWISSGERLESAVLARVRAALPRCTVLNLYGSTEVAGDVTCAAFAADSPTPDPVPIGMPLPNARLFVLDENRMPVAGGAEGELYVGGPVIARGYHRRPEEHAARFLSLPHLTEGPVFRTGDRVRRGPDGELYYVGRNDRQMKVRGVRIELDEVEAALLESVGPGATCAVVARTSPQGAERHVAAFVAPQTLDVSVIRAKLARRLPSGMMPAVILALEALPLLSNGKVDRQQLEAFQTPPAAAVPDATPMQQLVMSLWARMLPAPPASLDSDFHLLGGDSLGLVEFLAEAESLLGRSIAVDAIPQPLTVAAMAALLEQGTYAPASLTGIDILPVTQRHHDPLLALLIESFSLREPMAAALGAEPRDLLPFARALLQRCQSEPFSYVAVERASQRVVGFCLAHDFAGPALRFDARRDSPKLTPLFDLLAGLHTQYTQAVLPRPGQVLELAATGAAPDADGYTIAQALEGRALHDARGRGFHRVVSLCTNAVTRYLALTSQGGRLLGEVAYDTFVHERRNVFADAARHRGVALIEGHLV